MSDHTIVVTELIVRTTVLVVIECTDVQQAMRSVKEQLDSISWFKRESQIEERTWVRIEARELLGSAST